MNGISGKLKAEPGIGSQVLSIVLVFFFSVVLVNAVDLESIRKSIEGPPDQSGWLSATIFFVVTVVLYMLVLPSTVLGAASGVTFGIVGGSAVFVAATLVASFATYWLSRRLLRRPLQKLMRENTFLCNVESVIKGEGFRFLFLIRYTPIHATFISALLGIAGISPGRFLISCMFLLPEWILHVYVGYVAASTPPFTDGRGWDVDDFMRLISVVVAIGAIAYVGWVARKLMEGTRS